MSKFKIEVKLSEQLPANFSLDYSIFQKMILGSIKTTDLPEKLKFPYNNKIKDWKIEIIYDDYKSIAGKIAIPTLNEEIITSPEMGIVKEIDVDFIYSKLPVGREKYPSRWSTSFGSQISKKINNSINRVISDELQPEIFEKIRQYREFERIKNQQ